MSDETTPDAPARSPQQEAVRAEVQRIMADKAHPMHQGFWRGDPRVKEHITGLYRQAHGDAKLEITADGITPANPPKGAEGQPAPAAEGRKMAGGSAGPVEDDAELDAREMEHLRVEWGRDFDAWRQDTDELGERLVRAVPEIARAREILGEAHSRRLLLALRRHLTL